MSADDDDGGREGYEKLAQIATRLKIGEEVEPVKASDLLQWFQAKYRGRDINNKIRDALFQNNLRIEPDLNAQGLDGLIDFHAGVVTDEIEDEFFANYREVHAGSILNGIEAKMLNRLHHEFVGDVAVGWVDRNPRVTGTEIQDKVSELAKLDWEGLEREAGSYVTRLPDLTINIRLSPLEHLNVYYERKAKAGYAEHLDRRRLYQALGRFVFEYSQLEYMIRHALARVLELNDRFYAVTSPYDFSVLCRVTENIYRTVPGYTDNKGKELNELFKACLRINEERVKIVHGTWFISGEGLGTEHVARSSLKPKIYYSRVEDIDNAASECERLRSQIVKFLTDPPRRP